MTAELTSVTGWSHNRHSVHGIPKTSERRVGNVGLLIIQAAKQGSKDNLEFLLNLPGGRLVAHGRIQQLVGAAVEHP